MSRKRPQPPVKPFKKKPNPLKAAKITEARGELVGALITEPGEEVLVIMESGKVMRSSVDEVSVTGRNTQGVTFTRPEEGDRIIAIARNVEREFEDDDEAASETGEAAGAADASTGAENTVGLDESAECAGVDNAENSQESADGTIEPGPGSEENRTGVSDNPES